MDVTVLPHWSNSQVWWDGGRENALPSVTHRGNVGVPWWLLSLTSSTFTPPPLMDRLVNVYWMYSLIFMKYLWRYVAWIICLNLVREFVNQFPLPDSLRAIATLDKIIFSNIFNALLSVVKMGESRVLITFQVRSLLQWRQHLSQRRESETVNKLLVTDILWYPSFLELKEIKKTM